MNGGTIRGRRRFGRLFRLTLSAASAAITIVAMPCSASAQAPASDAAGRCQAMAAAIVPGTEITKAELVAAGPMPAPPGPATGPRSDSPEHCLIRGVLNSRTGAGGHAFGIGFELRMPTN